MTRWSTWWRVGVCALGFILASQACVLAEDRAPSKLLTTTAGSGGGGVGGFNPQGGGGGCVSSSLCGTDVHAVQFDVPNIYFILDRSGSMEELVPPDYDDDRYGVVRDAAIALVHDLGALINVGAALFPDDVDVDACGVGEQVMPVTPGLPPLEGGGESETTSDFRWATKTTPNGGTPIAATLAKLLPTLEELTGRTIVMLLTDGGPNCNPDTSCGVEDCIPNIEGQCPPTENCCAETHPEGGPLLCLDANPTVSTVAAIANLGIEVYVIGIPGSEPYAVLLDQMAEAGGTAQVDAPTKYHSVTDLGAIGDVFASIAADAISCTLPLSDPPAEDGNTNVYFDCDVIPLDSVDGWSWEGPDTVVLNGAACAQLKSGSVSEVHIITGCPTETPK